MALVSYVQQRFETRAITTCFLPVVSERRGFVEVSEKFTTLSICADRCMYSKSTGHRSLCTPLGTRSPKAGYLMVARGRVETAGYVTQGGRPFDRREGFHRQQWWLKSQVDISDRLFQVPIWPPPAPGI